MDDLTERHAPRYTPPGLDRAVQACIAVGHQLVPAGHTDQAEATLNEAQSATSVRVNGPELALGVLCVGRRNLEVALWWYILLPMAEGDVKVV